MSNTPILKQAQEEGAKPLHTQAPQGFSLNEVQVQKIEKDEYEIIQGKLLSTLL